MVERTNVLLALPKDLASELEKYAQTSATSSTLDEIRRALRVGVLIAKELERPLIQNAQSIEEIRNMVIHNHLQDFLTFAPITEDISAIDNQIQLDADFFIKSSQYKPQDNRAWNLRFGPALMGELNKISIKRHTTPESLLVEFVRYYLEIVKCLP